jgi:hypothetical protein
MIRAMRDLALRIGVSFAGAFVLAIIIWVTYAWLKAEGIWPYPWSTGQ